MTDAIEATGRNSLGRTGSPLLIVFRLAIGLIQGAALWWLYQSADAASSLCSAIPESRCPRVTWPATVPELFGPLSIILVMVPVLLLAGVGRMRWRTLLLWAIGATAFLALLGWHNVMAQATSPGYGPREYPPYLNMPMPLFAAAALFIGHHLVLASDMERRWIAAFPTYFDTAWKAGVQLALSIGFTGAVWLLIFLGAALFEVIGLRFLHDLSAEEWFNIPVTTLMFATAVHLTDVRDGLIRGVRSVVLMLLSWLLLLMTVLAAGFLAALPFTGLEGLWATGSATALVLAAAGVLIILINTAYQDGRADNLPPLILRITVRVAAVLLTPFILIAFWGLALRIGQHGLTPERIIALACAIVGAAYAAGYGFAALQPFWRKGTGWMQPLEKTNVVTALLEIAVILALFSPLADPARLSVADQMARLERGAVKPEQFDFAFLRFESGKAGEQALAQLAAFHDTKISAPARAAQASKNRYALADRHQSPDPVIEVWPAGAALPAGFMDSLDTRSERVHCRRKGDCLATVRDLDGDGRGEVLVARDNSLVIHQYSEHTKGWRRAASYNFPACPTVGDPDAREALKSGRLTAQSPRWPALSIDGGAPSHPRVTEDCRVPTTSDIESPDIR